MRKLLLAIAAVSLLIACGKSAAPPSYKINGTIETDELEGKQLVLTKLIDGRSIAIDTAVVAVGAFELTGSLDKPYFCAINIIDSTGSKLLTELIVQENDRLTVTVSASGTRVEGNEANQIFQQYVTQTDSIRKLMVEVNSHYKTLQAEKSSVPQAVEDSLQTVFSRLESEARLLTLAFVRTNINSPAGLAIFPRIVNSLGADQLKEIIGQADSASLATPLLESVSKRLTAMENVVVGKPYIDLRLQNKEGKDVQLAEAVSKKGFTLLHFWSSNCGSCHTQVKNLIKLYDKRKKEVAFVSISLDTDKEKWLSTVDTLAIPWMQLADFARNSVSTDTYAIISLPQLLLVDKDGVIVARDVRTDELDALLTTKFKNVQ